MAIRDVSVHQIVRERGFGAPEWVRGAFAERSEIVRIFNNEGRAKQTERAKRIEWNNVSLVVDVAIMSAAISRDPSRVCSSSSRLARFALLAHLLGRSDLECTASKRWLTGSGSSNLPGSSGKFLARAAS